MINYAVRRDECDVYTKFNSTTSTYTATAREISSDLITRAGNVKSINFQCKYNDIVTVTADEHFKPITSYTEIYSQTEQTTFKVRMSLFTDPAMTAALLDGQPIAIPNPVYSKLQVLGVRSSAMTVQLETCWATPTSDSNHLFSYMLIDNFAGTPAEMNSNNLGITQNCKNDVSSWWMNSFGFPRHDSVYMHCTVRICNPDHNTCTCGANTVRRRREDNVSTPDRGTIDIELKVKKQQFTRGWTISCSTRNQINYTNHITACHFTVHWSRFCCNRQFPELVRDWWAYHSEKCRSLKNTWSSCWLGRRHGVNWTLDILNPHSVLWFELQRTAVIKADSLNQLQSHPHRMNFFVREPVMIQLFAKIIKSNVGSFWWSAIYLIISLLDSISATTLVLRVTSYWTKKLCS